MSDTKSKTITIKSIEQKITSSGRNFVKIKDENNLIYNIWKLKKDGTESIASQNLNKLPNNGLGSTVDILFNENQSNYQGKAVTYRTINGLKSNQNQINQQPQQTNQPQQSNDVMEALRKIYNKLEEIEKIIKPSTSVQPLQQVQPTQINKTNSYSTEENSQIQIDEIPF